MLLAIQVAADAESAAMTDEQAMRKMDREPYEDAGGKRIVSTDAAAPNSKERNSSGRYVRAASMARSAVR